MMNENGTIKELQDSHSLRHQYNQFADGKLSHLKVFLRTNLIFSEWRLINPSRLEFLLRLDRNNIEDQSRSIPEVLNNPGLVLKVIFPSVRESSGNVFLFPQR